MNVYTASRAPPSSTLHLNSALATFNSTTMFLKVILLAIAHAFALPNTPCYTSISIATTGIPFITLHESAFHPITSIASPRPTPSSIDSHPLLNTTSCTPGTAECRFMMDKFRWCNAKGFCVGNYCGDEQVCCNKGTWGPECTTREGCGVPTDGRRTIARGVGGRGEDEEEGGVWW